MTPWLAIGAGLCVAFGVGGWTAFVLLVDELHVEVSDAIRNREP